MEAAGTRKARRSSLCVLEVLANSEKLPKNMAVIAIEIPESLAIEAVDSANIPGDWNAPAA